MIVLPNINPCWRRALAGALCLFLSACGDTKHDNQDSALDIPASTGSPAVAVNTTTAHRKSITKTVTATGAVYASKTTEIGPLVDGIIEKVFVQVGDRVDEGTPLFQTRQANYQSRFDEMQSGLALAEAELENARRELERSQSLRTEGVISQNRLDDAETQYHVADARFGMARAALGRAKQDFRDTQVQAPFRGTITRRNVDEGVYMSSRTAGQSSSGSVVQIQKIDFVVVIVLVPEVNIRDVSPDAQADITIDGLQKTISSHIAVINDRIDPETRSIEVRFYVENSDYQIKPGLFARAEIFAPAREATVVDRGAVIGPRDARYVFISKNGYAKRVSVEVSDIDVEFAEVINGISAGESVLIGPNLGRLYDGAPVQIGEF